MTNKYSPIWEQLKEKHSVVLAVPVPLHARVIKGLINCKDRDPVFKLMALEKKKRYRLDYTAESARIKIYLKEFDNMNAIGVEDF